MARRKILELAAFRLNTPPGSPLINIPYLVGPTPTGTWSADNATGKLAIYDGTSYTYLAGERGDIYFSTTLNAHFSVDGSDSYRKITGLARLQASKNGDKNVTTTTTRIDAWNSPLTIGPSEIDLDTSTGTITIGDYIAAVNVRGVFRIDGNTTPATDCRIGIYYENSLVAGSLAGASTSSSTAANTYTIAVEADILVNPGDTIDFRAVTIVGTSTNNRIEADGTMIRVVELQEFF